MIYPSHCMCCCHIVVILIFYSNNFYFQQKQDLQKVLSQKEAKLADVTKQYLASKEIINTITKVANSQLP